MIVRAASIAFVSLTLVSTTALTAGAATTPVPSAGSVAEPTVVVRGGGITTIKAKHRPGTQVKAQLRRGTGGSWKTVAVARANHRGKAKLQIPGVGKGKFLLRTVGSDGSTRSSRVHHLKIKKPLKKRYARSLAAMNKARINGVRCGGKWFRTNTQLRADGRLMRAAKQHAGDMAKRNYFSHVGRGGSSPQTRARWSGVTAPTAENIAAGYKSAKRTVKQWLDSPAHCRTIMSSRYKRVGVARASSAHSRYTHYWVSMFR